MAKERNKILIRIHNLSANGQFVISLFLLLFFYISAYSQISFKKDSIIEYYINWETVAIGDVNNDCLNDIVTATTFNLNEKFDCQLFIYHQNVSGTLDQRISFKYSNRPTIKSLKIGDVNHDFLNDIVIAYGDSMKVFFQDTGGDFSSFVSFYCGPITNGLNIGDLNNDGLNDIAVCNGSENYIDVFYQTGNKTYSHVAYTINQGGGDIYSAIIIDDLNGDGLNDLINFCRIKILTFYQSCSTSGISMSAYSNTYNNNYNYSPEINGIALGYLGDVNGKNSLSMTYGGNGSIVLIIDQDKNGILNSYPTTTIGGFEIPVQIKIADFDNDGINEITVGDADGEGLNICERRSDGSYHVLKMYGSYGADNPEAIAVGDLNNDNLPDIVQAGIGQVNIYYNTSKNMGIGNIKAINQHYPCQTLTTDSITDHAFSLRTVTGVENNCNYVKTYEKDIITKYLIQNGTGDSIITVNNCYKTLDTIKSNLLVHKRIIQSIDTLNEILRDTKYTFSSRSTSISGPNIICASSDPVTYKPINLDTSYIWYFQNDSLITQDANIVSTVTGIYPLIIKKTATVSDGSCIAYDTLNIQVIPNTLVPNTIFGNDTVCGETAQMYSVLRNENSVYTWTVSGGSFTQQGTNTISINFPDIAKTLITVIERDKNACTSPISVKEVIIKKITECISIPNVFTPNEDNVNDIFEIKNINLYPNNKLSVYNRWGSKVYESENYTGTWKAENIPDGIYFYNLEINTKPREKGWLQVIR